MISANRLRELVSYNPDTGVFTWDKGRVGCRAGDVVGSISGNGYVQICLDREKYYAHRLAFLYMTDSWPTEEVDHINGIKTDNRWTNLRQASSSENKCNRSKSSIPNTSGYTGVIYRQSRPRKPWQGRVGVKGQKRRYKSFPTPEEASDWVEQNRKELHREFNVKNAAENP